MEVDSLKEEESSLWRWPVLKEGERSSYTGGQFNRGRTVMLQRLLRMVMLQKWSL